MVTQRLPGIQLSISVHFPLLGEQRHSQDRPREASASAVTALGDGGWGTADGPCHAGRDQSRSAPGVGRVAVIKQVLGSSFRINTSFL